MVLAVHSNASYLSRPKARSWAGSTSSYSTTQLYHLTMEQYSAWHTYNQKRHVICNRGRTGGPVHHGTGGGVHQNNTQRIRTQTTTHTTPNRQYNGRHGYKWQDTTKTQSNEHEIPLATRSQMSRTILNILATRQIKLCRLLDKTSPRDTSLKYAQRIPHATHCAYNVMYWATTATTTYTGSTCSIKWHSNGHLARVWWSGEGLTLPKTDCQGTQYRPQSHAPLEVV